VIWRAGDREIIARPPHWDIKGSHLGVEVDVTMEQVSSPDWYIGTWDDMPKNGRGGRDFWAKTSGTITAGGKVYELEDNSLSINEHVVVGEHWINEAGSYPIQYFYHLFRSDDLQIFIYCRPDFDVVYSRVVFPDGKEIYYDWDSVIIEEEEYWLDPQTHMRPAVKFGIRLNSPEGNVELTLTAYSRSIYSFQFAEAMRTHYNMFVHSDGRFVHPDGRSTPIKDGWEDISFCEWGITSPLGNGVTPTLRR
jgi:hypothetical protein